MRSIVMPGASLLTRKLPTCGSASSVRAQTAMYRSPTAPVEKIFRPVTCHPRAVLAAIVFGRPPRAGVPSSGSTRSALISTGSAADSASAAR